VVLNWSEKSVVHCYFFRNDTWLYIAITPSDPTSKFSASQTSLALLQD